MATALAWAPAHAQLVRTTLPWRTVETAHFAFHFPTDLEAWTLYIAGHVEAIDSAVARVVGYAPRAKTQVVVDDPYETSNGSAWPYLNRPIINLWASPPSPREDIGEFHQWGEMLVSHEFTHIAHLTRPSRNDFTRHLWEALAVDLGPITYRAPRWAIEGYATYVEGRVTGAGRPHGVWRAAVLRQWALEGMLPRYDQLDAGSGYEGGEFAYLAGSGFLEWLVARNGGNDSTLVNVWRRLTARQTRSFDAAFTGVFGESPRVLYGRFTAEVTGEALEVQRAIAAGADTGMIVQRLALSTGDPAISHDGRRVALVQRSATRPSRIVIWGTAPEPDTGRARRDSILLAHDPEDVPAKSIYPPPKRVLATLRATSGAAFVDPRFLRDGRVLVWRYRTRQDGSLVSEAYLWDVARRSVRRITRNASVTAPDPTPDGRAAIATRCRHGQCDLVRVDLRNGAVATIDSGSPTLSYYRPRVSPDGSRAAVAVHTRAGWHVVLVDLAGGRSTDIPIRSSGNSYDVSWSSPTSLVYVSDADGIAEINEIDLTSAVERTLTRVTGAAVAPEPNPADGSIWFLSLYSRGYDVRRAVHPAANAAPAASLPRSLPPVLSTPPVDTSRFSENAVSSPRPFGLEPRLFRWLPTGSVDADGASGGVALISSDVIGRSELLAKGIAGQAGTWRGGAIDAIWRGSRPGIRLQAFAAEQDPNANAVDVALPVDLQARLAGGELALDGTHDSDAWAARYRLGASDAQLRQDAAPVFGMLTSTTTDRRMLVGDAGVGWLYRGGSATLSGTLAGDGTLGRSFDSGFERGVVSTTLGISGTSVLPLSASALYGRTNTDAPAFEQFALGGSPSSILDRTLLTQRITMPVLPTGISVGSSVFTYRASLNTQPLAVYFWGGSTAPANTRFASWMHVVGLDYSVSVPSIAFTGTPAARAQVGIGESLNAPLRHRVRVYAGLVMEP